MNLPTYSPDPDVLDDLCYQYHYDYRNRLIEKKIPGKDWESIVYDKLDRPVLTQDALLKQNNEWLFTKYDALGRVVYTGKLLDIDNNRSEFQALLSQETQLYEVHTSGTSNIAGTTVNYTNQAFPSQNVIEILTVNYYDTYNDMDGLSLPSQNSYGIDISTNTTSLPTVSKVRVLGTNHWITTLTGYDDKARPVYVATKNNYLNTTDTVDSHLDFVGKVLQTTANHAKNGQPSITTIDDFTYDHAARLLSQKQEIVGQAQERIVENYYDELGQLEKKDVGGETVFDGYTDLVGVSVDETGLITKTASTAWGNAGLATKGKISGNGYVEFVPEANDKSTMVGLSHINTDESYNTVDFAMYARFSQNIVIYESGTWKGNFGPYVAGDVLRVERIGTTIYYKKNGDVLYTSNTTSTGSLLGDAAIYNNGAQISGLYIASANLNTVLQTVDYSYNIRGWLKGINDNGTNGIGEDLFSFKLNYNNPTQGTPLYNGNISETLWQTVNDDNAGVSSRQYNYAYDALNRITEGLFSAVGTTTNINGHYNLQHVDYDKNGNIGVLRRHGVDDNDDLISGYMDDLTYTYNGNQLKGLEELGHTNYGFKEVNGATTIDYTYDDNGNMITDANKGITNISYNHLNLPTQVTTNNGNIQYIYDASGIKLKKLVNENGQSTIATLYAGNFIYEDNASGEVLKFFSQPEGYVEPTVTSSGVEMSYVYQYKDHLGNIRLSYSDTNKDGAIGTGEIIEENNYYPFGLKHKGYNNVINGTDHKYGFGGKEEQDELGLGWMDVTARNYDPALGRWMNLDPLAEEMRRHSPYNFAFDNPIFFQDYDGMAPQGPGDPPVETPDPVGWFKNQISKLLQPIGEAAIEAGNAISSLFEKEIEPRVSDGADATQTIGEVVSDASKNPTVKNVSKNLAQSAGAIGDVVAGIDLVKEFSENGVSEELIENAATEIISNATGPAAPLTQKVIENGKDENGVTNTSNLSRAYGNNGRTQSAYIYKNFTMRNQRSVDGRSAAQRNRAAYEKAQGNPIAMFWLRVLPARD